MWQRLEVMRGSKRGFVVVFKNHDRYEACIIFRLSNRQTQFSKNYHVVASKTCRGADEELGFEDLSLGL